jgi:hypothetical protein
MIIDNNERIIITAATASSQTDILISTDNGRRFTNRPVNMGEENHFAPRIFARADGGYLLFASRGFDQSLSIYYSRSDDAENWSAFEPFTPERTISHSFLPSHAAAANRDIVFFQALTTNIDSASMFQLYYKTSDNGGRTWTDARRFTTFNDPVMQTQAQANSFDNERPHLTIYGNNLLLVWERRFLNQQPQIYGAEISASGNIIGSVERINSVEA